MDVWGPWVKLAILFLKIIYVRNNQNSDLSWTKVLKNANPVLATHKALDFSVLYGLRGHIFSHFQYMEGKAVASVHLFLFIYKCTYYKWCDMQIKYIFHIQK